MKSQVKLLFLSKIRIYKWATSWENLFMPYANNKGADQPAHPCSLISTFVVRCLDSIILFVSISKLLSLFLAFVSEQAGLSLTWSLHPELKHEISSKLRFWSKIWIYRNDFFWDRSGQKYRPRSDCSLIRVYTVCHSISTFGCNSLWWSHVVQILGWLQQFVRMSELLGFLRYK